MLVVGSTARASPRRSRDVDHRNTIPRAIPHEDRSSSAPHKKSIVNQRDGGIDTHAPQRAEETPDARARRHLIGEILDKVTMERRCDCRNGHLCGEVPSTMPTRPRENPELLPESRQEHPENCRSI